MVLAIAAFAAQQVLSPTDLTVTRSRETVVSTLDLDRVEVREALRTLFREYRFGGTIDPDVQGVVTLSLRNVPFDTALQNVLRQVDATYRVDHGFFQVVARRDPIAALPFVPSSEASDAEIIVRSAYRSMSDAVVRGKGSQLTDYLTPGFQLRNATETKTGGEAVRTMIGFYRSHPKFSIERMVWGKGSLQYVVGFARPNAPTIYFRDFWAGSSTGEWKLTAREETALQPDLNFVNQPVSKILEVLSDQYRVGWRFDPSLDRKITINLSNLPFETALSKLIVSLGLTYRIEGGIYEILRR